MFVKELNNCSVDLKALSPNDRQYDSFLKSIVITEEGQSKKRIPLKENMISVVTDLKTCFDAILLGGDMENSSIGGWECICSDSYVDEKCHVHNTTSRK